MAATAGTLIQAAVQNLVRLHIVPSVSTASVPGEMTQGGQLVADTTLQALYLSSAAGTGRELGRVGPSPTITSTVQQSNNVPVTVNRGATEIHGRWITAELALTCTGSGVSGAQVIVQPAFAPGYVANSGLGYWFIARAAGAVDCGIAQRAGNDLWLRRSDGAAQPYALQINDSIIVQWTAEIS